MGARRVETSFQLAVRPELVKMDTMEGVETTPVAWDLVAPMVPVRTYGKRPRPERGHPAIFGLPNTASADSGHAFIQATVDALVEMMESLAVSYESRR